MVFSEYKEISGTQQPVKFKVTREGKLHGDFEVTEHKPETKLDDSRIAAP